MTNVIQHRRSNTPASVPSTLLAGELAVNTENGSLKAWLGQTDLSPIQLAMFSDIIVGNGSFQRKLSASVTLADGESVVVSNYIDTGAFDLQLDGDSVVEIL